MVNTVSSSSNNTLYELYLERLRNSQTKSTSESSDYADIASLLTSSDSDTSSSNDLLSVLSSSSTNSSTNDTSSDSSTIQGDISSIDSDGDGTISEDEYETMIAQMGIPNAMSAEDFFAKYDTDNDGELTASEMDASRPKNDGHLMPPPPMPEQSAENKNSSISASTDTATDSTDTTSSDTSSTLDTDSILNAMDSNSDGVVSASEFQSFMYSVQQAYESSFTYQSDDTTAETYAASI